MSDIIREEGAAEAEIETISVSDALLNEATAKFKSSNFLPVVL